MAFPLFTVYIDNTARGEPRKKEYISTNTSTQISLLFTDNQVFIAETECELKHAVNNLQISA
jgi:hypothetical protein